MKRNPRAIYPSKCAVLVALFAVLMGIYFPQPVLAFSFNSGLPNPIPPEAVKFTKDGVPFMVVPVLGPNGIITKTLNLESVYNTVQNNTSILALRAFYAARAQASAATAARLVKASGVVGIVIAGTLIGLTAIDCGLENQCWFSDHQFRSWLSGENLYSRGELSDVSFQAPMVACSSAANGQVVTACKQANDFSIVRNGWFYDVTCDQVWNNPSSSYYSACMNLVKTCVVQTTGVCMANGSIPLVDDSASVTSDDELKWCNGQTTHGDTPPTPLNCCKGRGEANPSYQYGECCGNLPLIGGICGGPQSVPNSAPLTLWSSGAAD